MGSRLEDTIYDSRVNKPRLNSPAIRTVYVAAYSRTIARIPVANVINDDVGSRARAGRFRIALRRNHAVNPKQREYASRGFVYPIRLELCAVNKQGHLNWRLGAGENVRSALVG